MKRIFTITAIILFVFAFAIQAEAQCSICTKTAQQLGEGPAKGLNAAILYLMTIPLTLIFFIGYRWYKKEKQIRRQEKNS